MATDFEKHCLEEFSHLILDANEKVTIPSVSDNYVKSPLECSALLQKWVDSQPNKNFKKEYLLHAVDSNDNIIISVISEEKLAELKNKLKDVRTTLYSVTKSTASPPLDLESLSTLQYKRLYLQESSLENPGWSGLHKSKLDKKETQKVDVEKQIPQNLINKPDNFDENRNTSQKSKQSEIAKAFSKVKTEVKPEVTEENGTDTKADTKSTSETSKKIIKSPEVKKRSPRKVQKGSIASFFMAKSVGNVKTEQVKVEKVLTTGNGGGETVDYTEESKSDKAKFEEETVESVVETEKVLSKNEEKSNKRETKKRRLENSPERNQSREGKRFRNSAATPTDIHSEKENQLKKLKSVGRRRIYVESSDEEENPTENELEQIRPKTPEQEVLIEEEEDQKPEKVLEEAVETKSKTFLDDDGFLITIRENKPRPKQEKKATPRKNNSMAALRKVPVKAATKQGSIRNFFPKK